MSRSPKPATPLEVATRYAELFNTGQYSAMGLLYAPDAVWRRPEPIPEVQGGAAIAAGYASPEAAVGFKAMRITSARYVADDSTVAAEFVFSGSGHTVHTIDLFEINEQGLITSMTVFSR